MADVFISYPQKERELMLPLKRRLEALGLVLFVDVDGRLDGSPTRWTRPCLGAGAHGRLRGRGCRLNAPWRKTRTSWLQWSARH